MSGRGMAKAKAEEVVGRTEELFGEAYGDAAAQVHGEAVRLRGEAEEDAELEAERSNEHATAERTRRRAEEAAQPSGITDR